jgi:hypothetical protein
VSASSASMPMARSSRTEMYCNPCRLERITSNAVMRVALRLLVDNYQFERGDVANSEAELYELIVDRIKR